MGTYYAGLCEDGPFHGGSLETESTSIPVFVDDAEVGEYRWDEDREVWQYREHEGIGPTSPPDPEEG